MKIGFSFEISLTETGPLSEQRVAEIINQALEKHLTPITHKLETILMDLKPVTDFIDATKAHFEAVSADLDILKTAADANATAMADLRTELAAAVDGPLPQTVIDALAAAEASSKLVQGKADDLAGREPPVAPEPPVVETPPADGSTPPADGATPPADTVSSS